MRVSDGEALGPTVCFFLIDFCFLLFQSSFLMFFFADGCCCSVCKKGMWNTEDRVSSIEFSLCRAK